MAEGVLASNKISNAREYRYYNVPAQFLGYAMYAQQASTSWLGDGETGWSIDIQITAAPVTVHVFTSSTGAPDGGFPLIASAQGWQQVYAAGFAGFATGFKRKDDAANEDTDIMIVYEKTLTEAGTETISGLSNTFVGGLLVSPGPSNDYGCYTSTSTGTTTMTTITTTMTTNTTTTTTTTTSTTTTEAKCGWIDDVVGGGVIWDASLVVNNESLINGVGCDYQYISPPEFLEGGEAWGNLKPSSGTPWPFVGAYANTDWVINFTGPLGMYVWTEGLHPGSTALRAALLGGGFSRVETYGFLRRRLSTSESYSIDVYTKYFHEPGFQTLVYNLPGTLVGGVLRDTQVVCTTTTSTTTTTTTTFHMVVLYNQTLYMDITNPPVDRATTCADIIQLPSPSLKALFKGMVAGAVPAVETRFITVTSLSCCAAPATVYPAPMTEVPAGTGYLCGSYTVLMEEWEVNQNNSQEEMLEVPATNMGGDGYMNEGTTMWAGIAASLTPSQQGLLSNVQINGVYTVPVETNMRAMNWFMSTFTSTSTTTTMTVEEAEVEVEDRMFWLIALIIALIIFCCLCFCLGLWLYYQKNRGEQYCA